MASRNNLCKSEHRRLFLAAQADVKTFPGGITGLSEQLEINKTTLANQLNPDHEATPPTLATILELINVTGGRRSLVALCSLGNCVPFSMVIEQRGKKEAIALFLGFVSTASKTLGSGSEFASDGNFDATECAQLEMLLMDLIKSAFELLNAIKA